MVPDLREILGFGPENITELTSPDDELWLPSKTVADNPVVQRALERFVGLRIDGEPVLRCCVNVLKFSLDGLTTSEHRMAALPSLAWECEHSIEWSDGFGEFFKRFEDVEQNRHRIVRITISGLRFAAEDLRALAPVVPEFSIFKKRRSLQTKKGTKSKSWWPIMAAIVRAVEAGKLKSKKAAHASEFDLWQTLLEDTEFAKHMRSEVEEPDATILAERTVKEQIYKLYRALYEAT